MKTYYEVREEQPANSRPEDKGNLIRTYETFAEAMRKARELTAQGRNVAVSRAA